MKEFGKLAKDENGSDVLLAVGVSTGGEKLVRVT